MSLAYHHETHRKELEPDRFKIIHSKKSVKFIDRWIMVIGILSPFTSLPQLFQIISSHDSQGVSLLTWFLYMLLAGFWLIYGIAHEAKPIIVNNTLWILLDIFIIAAILFYR
jgi:uncharacterized protein with PQ loop repeat